MGTPEVLMN